MKAWNKCSNPPYVCIAHIPVILMRTQNGTQELLQ